MGSRKNKIHGGPLVIHAHYIAAAHTYLALGAFFSALFLGCVLHYKNIVKNGVAGYPEEWFPSVSATIGDWFPERNIFQILIAITSGPRFALVFLQYFITRSTNSILPGCVFFAGIVRTLACGGWAYITSNDNHDVHDVLMILYILCNLPWMLGSIACTPLNHTQARRRRFFMSIVPMIYFFIQHKVHRIPGAYIFWSIFTSLIPTIFYFSVWELAISGPELALLATLSPVLLGIAPLHAWASTLKGRVVLHILSLIGIGAYALHKPLHRLYAVTFANSVLLIRQTVDWSTVMGLGLILSSLSKHANHSNNPVWPIVNEETGGWNKTGLALAVLAIYELSSRTTRSPEKDDNKKNTKEKIAKLAGTNQSLPWLTSSLALGSLLFSLHYLISDASTVITWSWTGYENGKPRGPLPNVHGSLTLIAQAVGILLPTFLHPQALLTHPAWFAYGTANAIVMYQYRNWIGYVGGLNLAVFLMSLLPPVLQQAAAAGKVGRTYFTAFFVVIILDLASIWTVAYAFVPGGIYLRERTDIVLLSQILLLSPAFRWRSSSTQSSYVTLNLRASYTQSTRLILALLSISSLLITLYRWPLVGPRPYKAGTRIFNAGIWTVHFGIDNVGRDSQRRMRDLIRRLDVVGLLETDLQRVVYGNRDLTRVITEDLGYYVDIGPGPNSHTWGAALLSKFPIINSTHHLLPSPNGELAPAIEAVLEVYGTEVTVVVAHNGQEQDPLDRELQSRELARIMARSYPQPVVFLGYVVTKPLARERECCSRVYDIDNQDWDRWCEYIFYRGLYRTSYARLSRGIVTDTELQIGQFWFPMEYYGNNNEGGVNGHFYHVFNTVSQPDTVHTMVSDIWMQPLYYDIPEGAIL
ncbi:hypothetical protein SERLADRAFT_369838 [Serpula lacrymans var. lacrymans S7.9]|uniref:Calcofluor white hypersensitive protein n=1 Tax=Serpula lacrymans var. lacrymans (strain S7.9) TaxID=578457 RepID=F8NXA4_SERL9|nr:uncharacterized protein SERLADRAFT_369838 [Serpula lacrymans var. lacrymans S7.9]EGO24579.1 hypothetical protein SERLADRAFT_369838 [Serpula lacrymans var. lacrymans S7.9]